MCSEPSSFDEVRLLKIVFTLQLYGICLWQHLFIVTVIVTIVHRLVLVVAAETKVGTVYCILYVTYCTVSGLLVLLFLNEINK